MKLFTATEQVRKCLRVIGQKNAEINAFIEVFEDEAREAARRSDLRRAAGHPLSPLDGIPFGLKDNFAYRGHLQTCAGKILQDYRSPYTATVVSRLLQAGMIPIGRLNMDEFAMGSSTTHSVYGKTRNPHRLSHTAGGSSGGSAAAVAAGMVPCALGSDTGGSIRQPAAYCGVVGLKPAYGALSRYGLTAFCSSLDCVGWLCDDVTLSWRLMSLLRGGDKQDATCDAALLSNLTDNPKTLPLKGLRIGIWDENTLQHMQSDVQAVWTQTCKRLQDAGARLLPMSFRDLERCGAVYTILSSAEAGSNLSRYDGIRYGNRVPDCESLTELYTKTRSRGFGEEVRHRLWIGAAALDNNAQDYFAALHAREEIRQALLAQLLQCDVLLTPTCPCTAPPLSSCSAPRDYAHAADVYCLPQSLAGCACISIPCGQADGMPVGLSLSARNEAFPSLLGAAMSLERLTSSQEVEML